MQDEIWRDAKGYEGIYEVSNYGKIKRIGAGTGAITGKILKARLTKTGYWQVHLSRNQKTKHVLVHRLVAFAFIDGYSPEKEVNHIDGNRANCHYSNLEWVTKSENQRHSVMLGLHNPMQGEKHGKAKLKESEVFYIKKSLAEKTKTAKELCEMFGTTRRQISKIKLGQRWKHVEID